MSDRKHKPAIDTVGDPLTWPLTKRLLTFIVAGIFAGVGIYLISKWVLGAPTMVYGYAELVALVASLSGALLWKDKVRAATQVLAFGMWLTIVLIAMSGAGIRTALAVVYPLIIILAGWLISERTALVFVVLTLLVTLVLAVIETFEETARYAPPVMVYWLIHSIVYVLAGGVVVYWLRVNRYRIAEVQKLATDVARLNAEAAYSKSLQQSEQRFRDFSHSSSDWFWETDPAGRFIFFSNPKDSMSDADWAHNLGKTRLELMAMDGLNPPQLIEQHLLQLQAREPFRELEYRILTKDAGIVWVSVSGVPYLDAVGQFAGYRGVAQRIQERKEAAMRLAEAKDAAEAANRAKSEFLSSMSHELRTPLNAVMGFAQLLAIDSTLSTEQQDNAAEIERAGQLLLNLINDILDFSRIESGKMEVNLRPVELEALSNDSFRLVTDMAQQAQVELIDAGGDGVAAVIHVDATRLLQVVLNFLTNAIKYNRPTGTVRLSCTRHSGAVRIAVTDTGIGIPTSKHSRVFGSFDRLGLENGPIEGTGIGLLITKRIVKAMNGTIGFESVEGQGSTFWAEFPICHEAETALQ